MITIGDYPLDVDVARDAAPPWLLPLIDSGRNAAYVDTWYLRALLNQFDDSHAIVLAHWRATTANFYTSPLVVAEAIRQLAKGDGVDQEWRWNRIGEAKVLFVDDREILICAPPEDVVRQAITELVDMQRSLPRLDLCDVLSLVILGALQHRRVLSVDDHFRAVGAALEP